MANVIKNVIRTLFTSSGADAVAADVERLGRSQTRLGKSSTGASRQFAAQASGLGGLVAAYAGAAATSFALSAAFDALAKSARATQTIQGVDTLAAGVAQSGSSLLKSIQDITKGQLTLTAAAEQASLALSAGFNTSQIENLSVVSLKASRALGRDLADSMTRVVRGSAKMETELLDELGIYTKIEPATRAYAAAIGKNVTALSEFERRQAFVNAVIAEGQRKFASINTTIPTSAEQIEALGAKLVNMATSLGSAIADMVAPLATGIVDNAAAAFGAFGLVLSLVAAKGIQLFSASIKSLETNLLSSLRSNENSIRARLGLTNAVLAATKANNALTDSVIKLNAADSASLKNIRDTAATRSLTKKEMVTSNQLLTKNKTLILAERDALKASTQAQRDAYRAAAAQGATGRASLATAKALPVGTFGSQEFRDRTAAINRANGEIRRATILEQQLRPAMDATRVSLASTSAALIANERAIRANTAATIGWRAALAGAATAAITPFIAGLRNIGNTFGFIVGKAAGLFAIISIVQLLGSTIANAIGKGDEFNAFFSSIGNGISTLISNTKAKDAKNTILGITGGALAELEKVDKSLRDTEKFSFVKRDSFFGIDIRIEKTKEQLVTEVSNILTDAGEEGGKSFWASFASGSAAAGGVVGAAFGGPIGAAVGAAIGAAFDYFVFDQSTAYALAEKYGTTIENKFGAKIKKLPQDVQAIAIRALAQIQDKYGDRALFDPAARGAKELQENLVFATVEATRTMEAIQQIAKATALGSAEISKSFDLSPAQDSIENINDEILGIPNSLSYVSSAITAIGDKKIQFLFIDDMNEQLTKLLDTMNNISSSTFKQAIGDISNIEEGISYNVTDASIDATAKKLTGAINRALKQGISASDIQKTLEAGSNPLGGSLSYLEQATVKALLANTTIEALANSVTQLGESYYKVSGSINEVQASSLQVSQILKTNNDEFSRGVLTLEKFSQNMSNSKEAIIQAKRALPGIAENITALSKAVKDMEIAKDPNLQAAKDALAAEETRLQVLTEGLDINSAILAEYSAQEDSIKRQIELTTFLKEQGKGVLSDIEFQFALVTAGTDNAKAASISYFNALASDSKAASLAAEEYQAKINELLILDPGIAASLTDSERAAILGASLQSITQMNDALKGLSTANRNIIDVMIADAGGLVEQSSQNALTVVDYSTEAIKKIAQQAGIELIGLSKKFREAVEDQIADLNTSLAELQTADNIAQLKFQIDMADIEAQGQQAGFAFQQAFKENQIKLIELQVDNKKIEPVSAAEQISALKTEIQNITEASIAAEEHAAAQKYLSESALRKADFEATKATIKAEGEQLKAKFKAEYQLLLDAARTYSAISTEMATALVGAGNAIGQAIVAAINSAIPALIGSLGPMATMLGISANPASFTPQPIPSVATTNVNTATGGFDNYVASLGPVDQAVIEATKSMGLLSTAVDASVTDKLALATAAFDREKDIADAEYRARADDIIRNKLLTAQERDILNEENEKRLADAKEAAGDAKEAAGDAAEAVELLTGRLADLKSAIDSSVNSALMGINDAIINGTEEGKNGKEVLLDAIRGIFTSIQEEVFKQTIANPLSDMISSWLVGGIKQLNLTDIRGSSLSGVLGSARGATGKDALAKNVMSDKAVVAGAEAFKKAGATISTGITSLGAGVNAAAGVGASAVSSAAGVLASTTTASTGAVAAANVTGASTLMSSLGPILAVLAVIAVIAGLFSGKKNKPASSISTDAARAVPANLNTAPTTINSIPKMAVGGLRDRLPTMLEPGEFVIRKPMVNRIGTPALESLNATGKVPNSAPVINIKNEGSPKDASASPPRFDGEKYVIDIVMRDLANNGPIRKSLRGGAL